MRLTTSAVLLLTLAAVPAAAQQADAAHAAAHTTAAAKVKWGPAPAIFPKGAKMAVINGDPMANGMFTVQLRFPNRYQIAPHTHPTDEHLRVVSGTFRVGMGTKADAKAMKTLRVGDTATAPANQPHFASARGTTVVEVNAMGPFAMTYVNPADTPRAARHR